MNDNYERLCTTAVYSNSVPQLLATVLYNRNIHIVASLPSYSSSLQDPRFGTLRLLNNGQARIYLQVRRTENCWTNFHTCLQALIVASSGKKSIEIKWGIHNHPAHYFVVYPEGQALQLQVAGGIQQQATQRNVN